MDESGTTQTALERPPPGPPPGLNASDEWPRPRRRWGRLIALVLVALLLVGGGGFAALRFFAPAYDDAIELVPRGSWFYASVFLDPSTSQKRAIRDLLEHFPAAGTPEEAGDRIIKALDEFLRREGLRFAEDIEPWLGNQVAVFGRGRIEEPDFAILIRSDDSDGTRDFIQKANAAAPGDEESRSYKGIDYQVTPDETASAILDGFLMLGNERGLKHAVDVTEGDRQSLAVSPQYESATGHLQDDRLALVYLDMPMLMETLVQQGDIPVDFSTVPLVASLFRPLALIFYARADSVVLEASMVVPDAAARSLLATGDGILADLPAAAWFAEGFDDLGGTLPDLLDALGRGGLPVGLLSMQIESETGLDLKRDILGWMEDAAIFMSGKDPSRLSVGFVVETSNPRASARAVTRLGSWLTRQGAPVRDATSRSFAVRGPRASERIDVIASDERVVATFGEGTPFAALGEGPRLRDSPVFRRASAGLGEGFEPALFVDAQGYIQGVESNVGIVSPVYHREVRPHLEPLSYVVAGTRVDGETVVIRMVVGVE